eukprot:PhM_4_TR8449/c0_g1_i2/m.103241
MNNKNKNNDENENDIFLSPEMMTENLSAVLRACVYGVYVPFATVVRLEGTPYIIMTIIPFQRSAATQNVEVEEGHVENVGVILPYLWDSVLKRIYCESLDDLKHAQKLLKLTTRTRGARDGRVYMLDVVLLQRPKQVNGFVGLENASLQTVLLNPATNPYALCTNGKEYAEKVHACADSFNPQHPMQTSLHFLTYARIILQTEQEEEAKKQAELEKIMLSSSSSSNNINVRERLSRSSLRSEADRTFSFIQRRDACGLVRAISLEILSLPHHNYIDRSFVVQPLTLAARTSGVDLIVAAMLERVLREYPTDGLDDTFLKDEWITMLSARGQTTHNASYYTEQLHIFERHGAGLRDIALRLAQVAEVKLTSGEYVEADRNHSQALACLEPHDFNDPLTLGTMFNAACGAYMLAQSLLPCNGEERATSRQAILTRSSRYFHTLRMASARSDNKHVVYLRKESVRNLVAVTLAEQNWSGAVDLLKALEAEGSWSAEVEEEVQRLKALCFLQSIGRSYLTRLHVMYTKQLARKLLVEEHDARGREQIVFSEASVSVLCHAHSLRSIQKVLKTLYHFQRLGRGYRARRNCAAAKARELPMFTLRQRVGRGYLGRLFVAHYKEYKKVEGAVCVQQWYRRRKLQKLTKQAQCEFEQMRMAQQRTDYSILLIQSVIRGFLGRCLRKRALRQANALASLAQRFGRGKLDRERVCRRMVQLMYWGACCLQRTFRRHRDIGIIARKKTQRLRTVQRQEAEEALCFLADILQRTARGYTVRVHFQRLQHLNAKTITIEAAYALGSLQLEATGRQTTADGSPSTSTQIYNQMLRTAYHRWRRNVTRRLAFGGRRRRTLSEVVQDYKADLLGPSRLLYLLQAAGRGCMEARNVLRIRVWTIQTNAALTLQRNYRKHRGRNFRKEIRRQREEMERDQWTRSLELMSATLLQGTFKCNVAKNVRKEREARREMLCVVHENKQRHDHAIAVVQGACRTWLTRRVMTARRQVWDAYEDHFAFEERMYITLRKIYNMDRSRVRRHILEEVVFGMISLDEFFLKHYGVAHSFPARQQILDTELEHAAASCVQNEVRCFQMRKELRRRRAVRQDAEAEARETELLEASASSIQRVFLGHLARTAAGQRRFDRDNNAATCIQRAARGYTSRYETGMSRFASLRAAAQLARRVGGAYLARFQLCQVRYRAAAAVAHRIMVGYATRRECQRRLARRRIELRCAAILAPATRAWMSSCRRAFQERIAIMRDSCSRNIHSVVTAYLDRRALGEWNRIVTAVAIRLQRAYRRYRLRAYRKNRIAARLRAAQHISEIRPGAHMGKFDRRKPPVRIAPYDLFGKTAHLVRSLTALERASREDIVDKHIQSYRDLCRTAVATAPLLRIESGELPPALLVFEPPVSAHRSNTGHVRLPSLNAPMMISSVPSNVATASGFSNGSDSVRQHPFDDDSSDSERFSVCSDSSMPNKNNNNNNNKALFNLRVNTIPDDTSSQASSVYGIALQAPTPISAPLQLPDSSLPTSSSVSPNSFSSNNNNNNNNSTTQPRTNSSDGPLPLLVLMSNNRKKSSELAPLARGESNLFNFPTPAPDASIPPPPPLPFHSMYGPRPSVLKPRSKSITLQSSYGSVSSMMSMRTSVETSTARSPAGSPMSYFHATHNKRLLCPDPKLAPQDQLEAWRREAQQLIDSVSTALHSGEDVTGLVDLTTMLHNARHLIDSALAQTEERSLYIYRRKQRLIWRGKLFVALGSLLVCEGNHVEAVRQLRHAASLTVNTVTAVQARLMACESLLSLKEGDAALPYARTALQEAVHLNNLELVAQGNLTLYRAQRASTLEKAAARKTLEAAVRQATASLGPDHPLTVQLRMAPHSYVAAAPSSGVK